MIADYDATTTRTTNSDEPIEEATAQLPSSPAAGTNEDGEEEEKREIVDDIEEGNAQEDLFDELETQIQLFS